MDAPPSQVQMDQVAIYSLYLEWYWLVKGMIVGDVQDKEILTGCVWLWEVIDGMGGIINISNILCTSQTYLGRYRPFALQEFFFYYIFYVNDLVLLKKWIYCYCWGTYS